MNNRIKLDPKQITAAIVKFEQSKSIAGAFPRPSWAGFSLSWAWLAPKLIQVEPLPPGALPIYEKDPEVGSEIVSEEEPDKK